MVASSLVLDGDSAECCFIEGIEEAEIVALVCCYFEWALKFLIFSVAGRADARFSVEGVHFEAGVVGDDDLAGCVTGVIDGLEARVAFEGGLVFSWSRDLLYAGERRESDVLRCGSGEVAKFAWVGGGDVEGHLSIGITQCSFDGISRVVMVIS